MATPADGKKIVEIYNRLDSDKAAYQAHLREISEYLVAVKFLYDQWVAGGKRHKNIYDGTAIRAHRVFANGLFGNLTPQATPWFSLTVKNKSIAEISNVKYWLADTTDRMRSAINASNTPLALQQVYRSEGWAGTAVLYVEPGKRYALNCQAFSIGNCCVLEDAEGVVDALYRLERFTCRQMIQKWGDKCSEKVQKAHKDQKYTETFDVIHAVYPRDDYNWNKADNLNMPYASVWVEKEAKNVLAESGYQEFPYAVPRWEKDEGEQYGRSPGMDALPDGRMLNQMCYDNWRGIQKQIDPPLLATSEAALSTTVTRPAGIIYYKPGHEPKQLQSNGRFEIALEVEEGRRRAIKDAFYNDLFQLLASDNRTDRTAYEISKRLEENIYILGPALGRQQVELLDPFLGRVFWLLFRAGAILPPPRELMGQGLEIEYTGRLALMMKAYETRATVDTLNAVAPLAQINPEIMDNYNLDEIAQGTALRAGVPVKYLNPPEFVAEIRQKRAEALKAQQEAETLERAAQQIPNLAKGAEKGSVLEALNQ